MSRGSANGHNEPSTTTEGILDADLLAMIELEPGHEYEWVFEYPDEHRETGRVRYRCPTTILASNGENQVVPLFDQLSPLTPGPVTIVMSR